MLLEIAQKVKIITNLETLNERHLSNKFIKIY